ncbi:MAG: GtrA family protein [Treponema sp.]|nr:GtrA family protein [Treponema sp.]
MKLKQTSIQIFLYLIVGGLATLVEWGAFYALNTVCALHYAPATALAFILSTAANWLFGRLILFHASKQNTAGELLKIYAVSIVGLLLNIAIMAVAVEKFAISEMISKILATGIVFGWNFLIRKLVIYKI